MAGKFLYELVKARLLTQVPEKDLKKAIAALQVRERHQPEVVITSMFSVVVIEIHSR